MTSAFIEAKQLTLALNRIPQNTSVTLTVLAKCRAIASYQENPIATSGTQALDLFVNSLTPLLKDVNAKLLYQSSHCLNISGDEHTNWDYQFIITFDNISAVTSLLSLEALHQILPHFYASCSTYETVISY
ncbi:hypothetical protein LP316_07875 [Thalassotalea sp. LPB0316]|uniref:hypothetical protein n=1 Tax=Thalassotalea sp. LPB0316 TaxID=2769490 RepID=UPI00186688A6|nr:hypothetical protein [Thalassotalea sp. LPB0316]QOL24304.1 hypothetical protein LP316_07875 [Thalassotalea sp. LPB0316]